ncbi:hypothetical protein [Sphingomonas sp. CFBP 8760]|uniref:hypothetical protein n=1 Tax=Sphingomonas sp. CFBP 8760 TaxID=2775282 RepID=UPI001783E6E5|nr:hypothetical protein [Sphingomonas sp. CFBP 8760]MBD8548123.1 hypothetical protein [Sphingomonas sp. CFBP 8760]
MGLPDLETNLFQTRSGIAHQLHAYGVIREPDGPEHRLHQTVVPGTTFVFRMLVILPFVAWPAHPETAAMHLAVEKRDGCIHKAIIDPDEASRAIVRHGFDPDRQ